MGKSQGSRWQQVSTILKLHKKKQFRERKKKSGNIQDWKDSAISKWGVKTCQAKSLLTNPAREWN